jgi:hypothetical protein
VISCVSVQIGVRIANIFVQLESGTVYTKPSVSGLLQTSCSYFANLLCQACCKPLQTFCDRCVARLLCQVFCNPLVSSVLQSSRVRLVTILCQVQYVANICVRHVASLLCQVCCKPRVWCVENLLSQVCCNPLASGMLQSSLARYVASSRVR